jgi:transcriptional regulator with XRE-family HTH domain
MQLVALWTLQLFTMLGNCLLSLGKRLKQIRESLKLSQQQFAEKLSIKSQSVYKVEKDLNGLSNETLINLIKNYNVNINWLLTGEGEMFKK